MLKEQLKQIEQWGKELKNIQLNQLTNYDDMSDLSCSIMYEIGNLLKDHKCKITIKNGNDVLICTDAKCGFNSCAIWVDTNFINYPISLNIMMDTTTFMVQDAKIIIEENGVTFTIEF